MKLSELITKQAAKSGLQADNTALNTFVSSLPDVDIPEDVINPITEYQNSLLTLDAAKSNVELTNHFKAIALNPVDDILSKSNWTPEQKLALNAETSTYKKLELAQNFYAENLTKAKEEGGQSADVTSYERTIEELNQQNKAQETTFQKQLEANDNKWKSEIKRNQITTELHSFDYGRGLTSQEGATLARNKMNSILSENNWSLNDKFEVVNSEGQTAYDNSEKVTWQTLKERAVQSYLKTSDSNPNGNKTKAIINDPGANKTTFQRSYEAQMQS